MELSPSVIALLGLNQMADLILGFGGIEAVEKRVLSLSSQLRITAQEHGHTVLSPPEPEGMTGINAIAVAGEGFQAYAQERGIYLCVRPASVLGEASARVTPHFFNNQEDIETLVGALDDYRGQLARTSPLLAHRQQEDLKIESIRYLTHFSTGNYVLTARIVDAATGEKVGGRVQIIGTEGAPIAPPDAMWKIGTGEPFFYSDGEFTLNVPRGRVQVTVERGTEYVPWRRTLEFNEPGDVEHVIELQRWCDPAADGWHPGNLHLHYKETEDDPDRRIMYDSRIEDLRVTALSYVKRWDLPTPATGTPLASLKSSPTTGTTSSAARRQGTTSGANHLYGFGHVMLLDLRNVVIPPGRGF